MPNWTCTAAAKAADRCSAEEPPSGRLATARMVMTSALPPRLAKIVRGNDFFTPHVHRPGAGAEVREKRKKSCRTKGNGWGVCKCVGTVEEEKSFQGGVCVRAAGPQRERDETKSQDSGFSQENRRAIGSGCDSTRESINREGKEERRGQLISNGKRRGSRKRVLS